MRPTLIILPFLLINLFFGVFTVATQNRYEVYPFTIYNLYSRIISETSYSTILYNDRAGNQHNFIQEIDDHPHFEVRNVINRLVDSPEDNALDVERLRRYINPRGMMYLVRVSGDSKALYAGELVTVDTLRSL